METDLAILIVGGIIAQAAPIAMAALGETITEKSGIINLSLDGTILLSAMASFAVGYKTGNLMAAFIAGSLTGACVASIVGIFGIYLEQSQVAVGFVLTLMTRDLAYFLGNSYSRLPGPQFSPLKLPGAEIAGIGPALLNHTLPVYLSLLLIGLTWFYLYKTTGGLKLRAVGENPQAAYARGIDPRKTRMLCVVLGGLLVGMAGATFSLAVKPGWGRPQGAEGTGWIALAIVIFGGWHPLKVAAGAYLFAALQVMGIYFQEWIPTVPSQVFQIAPFPLMIFTLVIMSAAQSEGMRRKAEKNRALGRFLRFFSADAPSALGKPFLD